MAFAEIEKMVQDKEQRARNDLLAKQREVQKMKDDIEEFCNIYNGTESIEEMKENLE